MYSKKNNNTNQNITKFKIMATHKTIVIFFSSNHVVMLVGQAKLSFDSIECTCESDCIFRCICTE